MTGHSAWKWATLLSLLTCFVAGPSHARIQPQAPKKGSLTTLCQPEKASDKKAPFFVQESPQSKLLYVRSFDLCISYQDGEKGFFGDTLNTIAPNLRGEHDHDSHDARYGLLGLYAERLQTYLQKKKLLNLEDQDPLGLKKTLPKLPKRTIAQELGPNATQDPFPNCRQRRHLLPKLMVGLVWSERVREDRETFHRFLDALYPLALWLERPNDQQKQTLKDLKKSPQGQWHFWIIERLQELAAMITKDFQMTCSQN